MADRKKVLLVTTSSSRAKRQLRNLAPKGPMLTAKGLDMGSQAGHCLTSVTKKELEELGKKTGLVAAFPTDKDDSSLPLRPELLFRLSPSMEGEAKSLQAST